MLFSSITFIYYFLPIFLLFYFLVPKKYRNFIILVFSLLFYFLGEPRYIILLLLSCFINYYLGKLIEKTNHKKLFLIIALIYNIGQLLIFKYTDFFIENINAIFKTNISYLYIVLPIGISFFTFQALSYIIDVYNNKVKASDNLLSFMMYISLFPQLVAGPIVRYSDIEKEIKNRTTNYSNFSSGVKRFITGLAKKVLIANVIGELPGLLIEETTLSSILKAISYTLQIYFDFSGYSDMAIGLGLILGFHFLENFNYPFIASSITDFWRRWHISLSSFFRDYVYIPLGGNRCSTLKWIRNILVVWFLTGFWHGASFNFIIWGLYFGVILIIEKLFLKKYLDKTKVFKHIYTMFIVIISFLIFSLPMKELLPELKNIFMISDVSFSGSEAIYYFKSYFIVIILACIFSTPLFSNIIKKLEQTKFKIVIDFIEPIYYLALLTLVTAYLIDSSFNPFLYFRF